MKTPLVLLISMLFLPVPTYSAEPPVPDGRRLRALAAEISPGGPFYLGGTTGWRTRPRGSGVIVDREFNYVTPENDYKQSTIHPMPGVWNWQAGDAWVRKGLEKRQVIRLHAPVGPQSSRWAKDDGRTPEELKRNLTEYMEAVCKRYDKVRHVKWLDVVNETVLSNGKWHGPRPGVDRWECPWTRIGFDDEHPLKPPLYIKMAFEVANRHAPNTKLIINQHAGMEEAMWQKVKALVPYLRDQGLRVDGIGWQAHINVGWEKQDGNMQRLRALIDWAHANKLSFHVTEMNVYLPGKEKDFDAQAETFAAVLGALLKRRASGEVTWNVWNISDRDAYRSEQQREGCLFDRQYAAKPAYYALQKLLADPPAPVASQAARARR